MDMIKGYFGVKLEVLEKLIVLERILFGIRKLVKELFFLVNNVIGCCVRCKVFFMFFVM